MTASARSPSSDLAILERDATSAPGRRCARSSAGGRWTPPMGFTPTAGLVMGTRCGDLDPAVPIWLQEQGLDREEVAEALDRHSGLLALAGEPDASAVLDAEAGDQRAADVLDVWGHRARAQVAAMAAVLGGSTCWRSAAGSGSTCRGCGRCWSSGCRSSVALDLDRNAAARGGDADLGADGAAVRAVAVAAREDLVIAEQVRLVLHR